MVYLFVGEDFFAKNQKIAELKKKILPSEEALQFDHEVLYAKECSAEELKKALVALPVVSSKRLIIVKTFQKADDQLKDLILDFLKRKEDRIDVILDADSDLSDKAFVAEIVSFGQVVQFKKATAPKRLFDMTNAMEAKKHEEALKNLLLLLKDGNHPLQVMGGLIWFWGKNKGRVTKQNFIKGLQFIQEADLNIKRSKIEPQYALEVLVLKLCLLISG